MIKLKVKEKSNLLDFLLTNTQYSRNKIKSLIKYKCIQIENKSIVKHDTILNPGQVVEISLEKKETKIGNIDIVYEDNKYLVVNKPSGMLTIATDKEKTRTLYHIVRDYIHSKKKNEKVFIVHRLDKETCGIVLFCKDEKLKQKMQENWEKCAIRREYTAVVKGILDKKSDKLVSYLKENKENIVYSTKDHNGKLAITNYSVKKENNNSLLNILIETGRKNQIRVQLNDIGHPILGDTKYGNIKGKKLLLCANRLDIRDLENGKIIKFEISIPREFIKNL